MPVAEKNDDSCLTLFDEKCPSDLGINYWS